MSLEWQFKDLRKPVQSLERQEPVQPLKKNGGWIKVRQVLVTGVRLFVKVVVTGALLYLIYISAISIAAYLSAPRPNF